MAPLTPADVKRWDADAIHGVFQTATNRAATLQTLGDSLQQVHSKLSDWQGEAGDAFRADLNKTRHDIETDGHESKQVAAAVACAEADVRSVKAELGGIEQAAGSYGFTITPDWRIDSGTMKLDGAKGVFKEQLQGLLDSCMLHAHSADQELASAVRGAYGDIPSTAGAPQPKPLQDNLLPVCPGSGDPAKGPPVPGDPGTGKTPSLKPAEIESFKAMARQTMISDGVPPDQIEARLNAVVANTQQWLAAGAPNYIAPQGPRMAPPGFGEGFGDRWNATEDAIHNLTGQNGLGAMGDAWGGMAKGLGQKAEDYLMYGPAAPFKNAAQEIQGAIDSPSLAYYLGEKSADAAITAPTLMFGGEGAGLRAGIGEVGGLEGAAGVAHDLPAVHSPLSSLEDALPGLHAPTSPHESRISDLFHPSGPIEDPPPSGHGLTGAPEPPALGGHPLPGPDQPSVLPSHPHIGAGDTEAHVPVDHSVAEGNHDVEPFAVDGDGHYLPGSLPSYEQLQGITSTEPDRAFYWSGRNAEGIGVGPDDSGIAELIAHGSGGTTLEMTLADKGLDPLPVWNRHDPVSVQFWEDASASYAENARGEVTAIVGSDLRPGNVWQTVEIPRLMENPDVTRILQVDPDTGLSTVIFDRGK